MMIKTLPFACGIAATLLLQLGGCVSAPADTTQSTLSKKTAISGMPMTAWFFKLCFMVVKRRKKSSWLRSRLRRIPTQEPGVDYRDSRGQPLKNSPARFAAQRNTTSPMACTGSPSKLPSGPALPPLMSASPLAWVTSK